MGKLLILDSNSLMHRAYHALPPMNNKDGTPTQAIFGFLNMLLKIISTEQPTHLIAAFDAKGPTFRHESFAEYKGTRKETDDELRMQFPIIKELLRAMGIAVCEQAGYEADDLLGIFSRRGEAEGLAVRLVTGDRDALQLVSENVNVILTRKGITETELYDDAALFERYGVSPAQMIEVKGLMGDTSDNIPGIPGVGEKTALKLIQEFASVEGVLGHIPQVSGEKLKEKLGEYADQARMSRELARIVIDPESPIPMTVDESVFDHNKMAGGRPLLQKLELRSLLARLPEEAKPAENKQPEKAEAAVMELRTVEELRKAADEWLKADTIAIVWETSLSVAVCGELEYRVQLAQNLIEPGIDWEEALTALAPVLSARKPQKRLFDAKKWMHTLAVRNLTLGAVSSDALIAAYLLNPTRSAYGLAQLCEEYIGRKDGGAASLCALCTEFAGRMEQSGLTKLYETVELPLIGVLFDMERGGLRGGRRRASRAGRAVFPPH